MICCYYFARKLYQNFCVPRIDILLRKANFSAFSVITRKFIFGFFRFVNLFENTEFLLLFTPISVAPKGERQLYEHPDFAGQVDHEPACGIASTRPQNSREAQEKGCLY